MFISFLQTRSDYRIRLNGDWDMDIPKGYHQLKQYCATLAHKANHSFTPNVEWGIFEHPRFGLIRSLRAIRDLKKGDEVWGWMLKDFTIKPHFPSCWSTTTWQWRSLPSGTARYVWPQCSNSIVLFRFGSSGCGRQRKMTQQSKGSDFCIYVRMFERFLLSGLAIRLSPPLCSILFDKVSAKRATFVPKWS